MDAVSELTVHKLGYFQGHHYYAKLNNENTFTENYDYDVCNA